MKTFPWLNLALTGGERLTWYGDTLNETQTAFTGNTLTRTFPFGGAEIIGPSVSKIFNGKLGDLGKFKHIIEPRFTYTYQGGVGRHADLDAAVRRDRLPVGRQLRPHRARQPPAGQARTPRPASPARCCSSRSPATTASTTRRRCRARADPTVTSNAGPLETLLRFNPTEKISLTATATYDTLFRGISSTGLTGSYGFGAGNAWPPPGSPARARRRTARRATRRG